MKKLWMYVLLICGLSSCSWKFGFEPTPEVRDFLNDVSLKESIDYTKTIHSEEIFKIVGLDGNERGVSSTFVSADLTSIDDLYYEETRNFSGETIDENTKLTYSEAIMVKDNDIYNIMETSNLKPNWHKNELSPLEKEKALDLIKSLIYVEDNYYANGGLYYGDIFQINTNSFPPDAFYVKDGLCHFDYKYLSYKYDDKGNVKATLQVTQDISINKYGLVVKAIESVHIEGTDYKGVSVKEIKYNEKINRKTIKGENNEPTSPIS